VEYPKGKILYREGDIGQTVYLIQAGQIIVENDVPGYGPVTLVTVGPGQLLGWSALFPGRRKVATARVAKPVRAIVINAARLRDACHTDHTLESVVIRNVSEVIADRLKATRQKLIETVTSAQEPPRK